MQTPHTDAMRHASEGLTPGALRAQLGAAYARFDDAAASRHVALLNEVGAGASLAMAADQIDGDRWSLAISCEDAVGALSLIAGLCTACGIDIEAGDVFTVEAPGGTETVVRVDARTGRPRRVATGSAPARRRVLDVFEVRREAADAAFWGRFEADLGDLMKLIISGQGEAARDRVITRVSDVLRAVRSDEAPLAATLVEVDNAASETSTVLRIRAEDAPGFLFEFTNALALLQVNIERAEVRTVDGQTLDTFWVTEGPGRGRIGSAARLDQLRVAAALIKQFTLLLPRSPNPAQALRQFSALTRQLLSRPEWTSELRDLESGDVLRTLAELMGVSEFLWEDFLRIQHENLFPVLGDLPGLDAERPAEELRRLLRGRLEGAGDLAARRRALNAFKDREMFRIDLRHISGRTDFGAFADELSALAEAVVEAAAALAEESVAMRHGRPRDATGQPCGWVTCALGKFGGRELGFASDIELLFVYEGEGLTDGPEPVSNAEYFDACVQELLRTIVTRSEGIFEIDLRLRPHGNAGSLATSLEGFKRYYAGDGEAQQFERMALVKLRPVAGDADLARRVVEARDTFVYSGAPLDLENVRHLRGRQARELVPAGEVSAKHSAGGVVDIEYFVQARQIESGATEPSVRVTGTREAIARLVAAGALDAGSGERLGDAYSFLRRLIDGLRVVRGNAKDLTIPPRDSQAFAYLARRLRIETTEELAAAIDTHMRSAAGVWGHADADLPPGRTGRG
ncbi:MAG: ACT domain-containing protein [Dehalococcoidia bacterium]